MTKSKQLRHRPLVLVVDDQEINRDTLGIILEDDYDILYAENGKEALALVREHQEKVYDGHYSGVRLYAFPHYDKLAEAYDMAYFHADSNEALGEELDRFLACEGAAIMVCDVDSENNTK